MTVQDVATHNSQVIAHLDGRLRGLEKSRESGDNISMIRNLESSLKQAIKKKTRKPCKNWHFVIHKQYHN